MVRCPRCKDKGLVKFNGGNPMCLTCKQYVTEPVVRSLPAKMIDGRLTIQRPDATL